MSDKNHEIDITELAAKTESSKAAKITNFILLLICIALAAIIGYRFLTAEDKAIDAGSAAAAETSVINVSASPARIGTFVKISRLNGEIRRDGKDIAITPDITTTGTVTQILVNEGDAVNPGDIVAYVDASRPGSVYKLSPVTAKSAGIISSVDVSVGQTVSSSSAIATITDDTDLILAAAVPEKFLGSLRPGMSAEFETVAYPGKRYKATLTYIAPALNTASRTADIQLSIDDAAGLKAGMYVKLRLETERIENALIVPYDALDEYIGDDVVYVADGDVASRRIVSVGSTNESEAVILSGLEEGELVITAGNITDGSAINAVREG